MYLLRIFGKGQVSPELEIRETINKRYASQNIHPSSSELNKKSQNKPCNLFIKNKVVKVKEDKIIQEFKIK